MRKQIQERSDGILIINSGCANTYIGKRGYEDAVAMTCFAGKALGVESHRVGMVSVGVIGS